MSSSLTDTQISAEARKVLADNGFTEGEPPDEWRKKDRSAFLFEDVYSIVGVVLYATCDELIGEWPEDQGALSSKITKYIGRGEAKSSDGYLVLLTTGLPKDEQREVFTRIRYDTYRLRKLVATGEDLTTIADVEKALRPVLPLQISSTEAPHSSGLDELPRLLDLPEGATKRLVDAYRDQDSLLEALHEYTQNR